jgi:hypothetical protein
VAGCDALLCARRLLEEARQSSLRGEEEVVVLDVERVDADVDVEERRWFGINK